MTAQIASFNCILKNKYGQLISSSINRDVLTSIPFEGALLSGLARGLQDLKKGEKRSISLAAEQAYGVYDPKKVVLFPRKKIPDSQSIRTGQNISILSNSNVVHSYKVMQIYGEMVALDGNHPLAGQDLVFEIEVIAVRDATADELSDSQHTVSAQLLH